MELNVKKILEPEIPVNEVSRISAGTIIKGDIYSDCDIRIDGKVEGRVLSKGKIVVGNQAEIKGGIACVVSDIWGKISGEVDIKDMLSLKNSAVVDGNVNVNKIQVEVGASVNGSFHMITPEQFEKMESDFIAIAPKKK